MKTIGLFICLIITACTAEYCVKVASGCLRLRATPSLSGLQVACMAHGQKVEDLNTARWSDNILWRNIRYSGKSGWASADYLVHCGTAPYQPPITAAPSDRIFRRIPFNVMQPISQFYGDTRSARDYQAIFYGATQGMHSGLDWSVATGTRVVSMCRGLVVHAGMHSPFGHGPRTVIVRCGDWYVLYGHLEAEYVVRGQEVSEGHALGSSGLSGSSHLHLEVRPVPAAVRDTWDIHAHPAHAAKAVNPVPLFDSALLAGHFEPSLLALGGSRHFCTGTMMSQPDIEFGGPLRSDSCTN